MLNRNLLLAGAACIGLSAAPAALSAQSIVIASDNASNYAPWEDGSNGGFGFGPWGISADGGDGGFAGVFTGNPGSAGITGLPDPSFSMFANPNTSGAFAVAARALANPLPVGGSLSFEWAVNWDSDGGNKGFNIFAGSDQVVNVNQGGFPGELFLNTVDTGLAYGTGPMLWTFTMESADTLRVTSTARDGDTAAPPSVDVTVPVSNPLSGFAFYVDNMGGGDQRQPYFNNFEARIPAGPIVVDAPFADPAAVVAGRGAHPNSPVELFVDGAPAAQSIANAVGEFSFAPMALDGGEELVVRAQQSWYFDAGDEGFLNNDPSQATVAASGGNLVLTPTAAGSAPWIVAPLPPFGHPTSALRVLEIRMRNGAGTPTLAITTNSPALPTLPAFTIGLSTNPAEYSTYLVPIVGEVQAGTQPPGTDNFLLALQFFPAGSTDPIEIDYIRVREDIAYEFDTDGDFQQFDFFDPFLDFAGVSDGALQLVANGTAPQRVFMLNQPFYNYDGNLFNRMHITQAVSSASANQLLWEYRTFEPPLVFDGVPDGNFVQVTDAIPDAAGTLFDNTGQMTTYILDPTGSPNFNNPAHERHPYFFWSFANLLSAGDTVSIDRIALTSANPFGPSAPVEVPIPPAVFNIATGLGYPDIDSAVQAPETLDGHVLEIREDLVGQLLPAGPNDTYPWKNVVLRGDDPTRTVAGRFNFIGAGIDVRIESLDIDATGLANPITVGMGAILELEDVHVANSIGNGVRMMNTGGTLTWEGGSSTGHAGNGIANQGGVVVAEGVSISNNAGRGLFALNTTSTTTLVDCTVANNALAGITAAAVASGHAIILDGTDLVGNNTAAGEAPGAQVILNGGAFSMSGGSFSGTGNFDVFAVETNGQGGSTADFTGVSFGTAAANNFIISNNYDFLFVDCTIASTGGFVFNPRNGTTTVRDSVINAPRIANYGFATNGASPALVIEDTAINATGLGAQLFQFNNGSFDGGGEAFRADNTLEIRGSRIVWDTVGAPGNMAIGLNGEHTVAIVVEDTDIVDAFGGGGGFFNNQPQAVYNLSMAGSTMKDFGNAIVDLGEAAGGSITIDQCDFLSTAGRRTALLLLPAAVSTVAITDSIFSDAAIFNQAPGATVSEDFNFLDQRGGATLLNGPIASGGSSIATAGVANGFSALYCSTDFGDPKYLAIATQSPANGLNSVGPETYAGAKGVDCDACDDDQFPPVLACAAPFAIQTVDGIASVDEADIVLSLTDNCTTATIVSPSFPVTFFAPGVYTVTVVAADEAGNTATCSVQVTVETGADDIVVLAYWAQNDNGLPNGGFGFLADPDVFPQPADIGTGDLTVGGGITAETTTSTGGDTVYRWLPSFAGSPINALPGFPGGGSIGLEGGTDLGNNGAYFEFAVPMAGLGDLEVSYAWRRTSTGFNTQTWSWSTNGVDFTDFETLTGGTTSFALRSVSVPSDVDRFGTAYLRITFDDASASGGNIRMDNILFTAQRLDPPPFVTIVVDDDPSTDAPYNDGIGGNFSGPGGVAAAVAAANNDASGAPAFFINIIDTDGVADTYTGDLHLAPANDRRIVIRQVPNGNDNDAAATLVGAGAGVAGAAFLLQGDESALIGLSPDKPLRLDLGGNPITTGAIASGILFENVEYVAVGGSLDHNDFGAALSLVPGTTFRHATFRVGNGPQVFNDTLFEDCLFAGGGFPFVVQAGDQTFVRCEFTAKAGPMHFGGAANTSSATFVDCVFGMQGTRILDAPATGVLSTGGTFHFIDPVFSGRNGDIAFDLGNRNATVIIEGTDPAAKVDLDPMVAGGNVLIGRLQSGAFEFINVRASLRGPAGFLDASGGPLGGDISVAMDGCFWANGAGDLLFNGSAAPGVGDPDRDITITAVNTVWLGTPAVAFIDATGPHTGTTTVNLLHCTMAGPTGNVQIHSSAPVTANLVVNADYSVFDTSQTVSTFGSGLVGLTGVRNLVNGSGYPAAPGQGTDTVFANPMLASDGSITCASPAANAAVGSALAVDIVGNPRPGALTGVADIGAYEAQDNALPAVACVPDITVETTAGVAVVEESDLVVSLTDGCGPAAVVSPSFPLYFYEPGDFLVTVTVADDGGNTATCVVEVTVELGADGTEILAYWSFNREPLPGGGFGWLADPDAFPHPADIGIGSAIPGGGLGGIILDTTTTAGGDLVYEWIQSFAGTTVNALPGFGSGGTLTLLGGPGNGNFGAYFDFIVSTEGYEDLVLSYATRGTSMGFTTQTWSWSLDGVDFTEFQVETGTNVTTFGARAFALPAEVEDESSVILRVVFEGASASDGNNRIDNVLLTGSAIPPAPPLPVATAICADSGIITESGLYPFDTTAGSTDTAVCSIGGSSLASPTVWFRVVSPVDGIARFSACSDENAVNGGATFDSLFAVLDGFCPTTSTACLGGTDLCGFASGTHFVTVPVTAGQELSVQLNGWGTTNFGTGELFVEFVEQEPGPDVPGDTCETAIDISAGGVFPFDTTDASDNDPFWGPGYPTVFFEWTTPAAGIWVLDTCGSSFNTWVSVYVAPTCPTGTPALNPNDSLTICPGDEVVSGRYILTVPEGLRIVVSVQGFDVDEAGPGVLSSYFTPNDEAPLGLVGGANCQEATPVGKGTYDIDLTAFGDPVVPASFLPDSGAPSTDPATLEPAAWVSYTPVETGIFWISLCNGTNFDTTLAVYESCPTGITDTDPLIALNDDSTACTSGVGASALGLMGEAGQTYLIAISAFPGTPTGQARLQITGAQAQTNLNELVTWPPIPGLPFVELDGPAYGAIDRLAFLVIDEDGTITGAFDLADSGQRLSAKGLHVLVDDASGGGQPPVRSIFEWPVIYPFLATLGEADLISNPLDPFGLLLDGPARTFVLVRDFSGSIGDTIDPEGDGTVGATPWQRTLDAVSYSFGPSFFEYGAHLGGTSLGTPRNFDDSGDHFADWMFRDIATGEWQTAELDGFFGGPGDPEQPGTRAARDFDAFVAFGAGPGPFLSDERYANLAATPGYYNPLETAPVAGVLQDFSDTECGTSLVLLWDGFFDAETLVQAYEVTLGLAPGGDDLFDAVVSSNTRSLILSVGSPLPQGLDLFWTVTAVNDVGQLTSAGLGITILDTTPPVVADVELDVFLDATGNGSIALADLLSPDTTDNCSTPVVIDADRLDFDCDDAFATLDGASPTITFVVSDAVGNTATGTATINVFDENPVTLVTQPFVVFLDANGQATVSPDSFVNFALSGAGCGTITAVSVVPDTFTCADAAATQAGQIPTVVVTVSDEFGNTATGTTIAPVADAVEPALFCLEEVTIPVSALDGTVLITADDLFSSPPVDACGIQSIQLSRTLFDCGDVAATLAGNPPVVTVVVRDIYNNSSTCSVVVNIVDDTPPVLVVADVDAILDGDGFASIDTADLVASASDNCSFALSFDGPTEFTCDDLGEPIGILVTATDQSGNTTTQTAFVTVIDPTDPVVECPDELIVVICNDPDGFFFVPDVTDNCAWTYSIDGFPDAILPYGLTEGVTVRIFDALGEQTAVCVFDIEVIGDVQERLRLQSIAQFDGELTVNAAGAVVSLNSTATSFFVGDTTANNTTRGFLAMDTSAIPADAIISRAAVRLHRFNERGSSSDLGFLQVDILDPATTTPGIALEDFDSVPLFANAGLPVPPPPSIGGGMSIPLRSDAYDALDRGGLTIFRLQFPVDTDFDGLADGLSFGTGENGAFNTFTPELIVEFYTPTCDGCGINDPVFAGPDVIGPIAVPAIVGQTGFVTESFETSEVGGAANSTSTVFNVGDTALNQQTIGILSFNTGSVGIDPSDYIQRAELRLSRASTRGDVSDLGGLVVDMRCLSWNQPFFGLSPAVEPADFQADVLPVPVAIVGQVGSSFDFSAELDAVGRENINRDGVTQMKLRFELDDNDNSRADNIGFFSANASVAARRPVLLLWIRPTTLQPRTSELADPSDRLTDFSDFQKDAGTIRALEQDFLLP